MPSWDDVKRFVRLMMVVAIVAGTTWVAALVRDDWVGLLVGLSAGLVLGVVFVYANWPALDE